MLSENLQQALVTRATIEQAKGIIMATMGVTPEQAFDHLRRQSQHENIKLHEIAAEIVERASRPR